MTGEKNYTYEAVIKLPLVMRPFIMKWEEYDELHDELVVRVPSIAEAKEGFWVNHNLKFTTLSDRMFWIPPSKIECVRRTKNETE